MAEMTDLLEMTGEADLLLLHSHRLSEAIVPHECDGCGEVWPDVELWATDHETGEELWLCLSCGC